MVWVNDIIIAASGGERVAKVKAHLVSKFDVRDLVGATYFLGMELVRDRAARTLKLGQKKLTGELLGRYELTDACARSVPFDVREKLTKEGEPLDTAKFSDSELVGRLLYLTVCTRPNIAQVVGALARYMSAPPVALGSYLAGTGDQPG